MNILVCIKQVPDTTEIKIDPVKNTLIREGVPSIVNTFDTYALETALRLKEKNGGSVTVLSMGPEQAKAALKECLSVGADKAYLASDRAFGGSDTLATSFIITNVIKYLEKEAGKFDVIFCGKQAIDGDTAQVGPEIAEHLGYPQVTYVSEVNMEGEELLVKRESDQGYDIISVQTPAVITVVKTAYEPRYATIKSKIAANRAQIATITVADMPDMDLTRCGLKGSATKVKKTYTPIRSANCYLINEETPQQSAQKLVYLLSEEKII